ncbi:MAG: hypothetical protein P1U34_08115, partial [Coxiellaceae bacterium]|nr:hypothetical protein [Coxiellaceae bacterium]
PAQPIPPTPSEPEPEPEHKAPTDTSAPASSASTRPTRSEIEKARQYTNVINIKTQNVLLHKSSIIAKTAEAGAEAKLAQDALTEVERLITTVNSRTGDDSRVDNLESLQQAEAELEKINKAADNTLIKYQETEDQFVLIEQACEDAQTALDKISEHAELSAGGAAQIETQLNPARNEALRSLRQASQAKDEASVAQGRIEALRQQITELAQAQRTISVVAAPIQTAAVASEPEPTEPEPAVPESAVPEPADTADTAAPEHKPPAQPAQPRSVVATARPLPQPSPAASKPLALADAPKHEPPAKPAQPLPQPGPTASKPLAHADVPARPLPRPSFSTFHRARFLRQPTAMPRPAQVRLPIGMMQQLAAAMLANTIATDIRKQLTATPTTAPVRIEDKPEDKPANPANLANPVNPVNTQTGSATSRGNVSTANRTETTPPVMVKNEYKEFIQKNYPEHEFYKKGQNQPREENQQIAGQQEPTNVVVLPFHNKEAVNQFLDEFIGKHPNLKDTVLELNPEYAATKQPLDKQDQPAISPEQRAAASTAATESSQQPPARRA